MKIINKILWIILFCLIGLNLALSQTPVWNLDPTIDYVICTRDGQEQYFTYSDVQNNPAHTNFDLNNFSLIDVQILQFYDADAGGDTWNLLEKGTTGEFWIQRSTQAAEDFSISNAGVVKFGGTTFPTSTGSTGQILKLSAPGVLGWAADDTGGGGGSSFPEYFLGQHTSTILLTANTWTNVQWGTNVKVDASFTHSTPSEVITLNSAGTYLISVSVQIDQVSGENRHDLYMHVEADNGGGYSLIPGGYASDGTVTFANNSTNQLGLAIAEIPYVAAAGDNIRVQVYDDTGSTWSIGSAGITIKRIE